MLLRMHTFEAQIVDGNMQNLTSGRGKLLSAELVHCEGFRIRAGQTLGMEVNLRTYFGQPEYGLKISTIATI